MVYLCNVSSQCDQIGWFLKVLSDKFSYKSGPNIRQLFGLFRKTLILSENCWGYFLVNFWMYLGYFYFNIWSHCFKLLHFPIQFSLFGKTFLLNWHFCLFTFGMTEQPRWIPHRRTTWPSVRPTTKIGEISWLPVLKVLKGSFTFTAVVCRFLSRLCQRRDINFSISLHQCHSLQCQMQLVWMSLKEGNLLSFKLFGNEMHKFAF